jgi:hypothetical protein
MYLIYFLLLDRGYEFGGDMNITTPKYGNILSTLPMTEDVELYQLAKVFVRVL